MTTRSALDRKFIAAVDRLGRALRVARQQVATRHQVSLLQLQVLDHLSALGPRRVGFLARELDVTQPTISDALAVLEAKGIARREPDEQDARATVVTLTPSGFDLAQAIANEMVPLLEVRRKSSDRDQAAALGVVLEEILHLERQGVISVNRSCPACVHYRPPSDSETGHCLFLDEILNRRDLRVDCPDHLAAV